MKNLNVKCIVLAFAAVAATAGCARIEENNEAIQRLEESKKTRVALADREVFANNGFEIVASLSMRPSTVSNCYTLKKAGNDLTYVGCAHNDSDFVSSIRSLRALEDMSQQPMLKK